MITNGDDYRERFYITDTYPLMMHRDFGSCARFPRLLCVALLYRTAFELVRDRVRMGHQPDRETGVDD